MAVAGIEPVVRHLRRAVLGREAARLTDGRLLEDFVSRRDPAAFEALVRRHGPMVLGVCRRVLRNPHDAEDAFQATFLVLARNAASVRRPAALASWLYGVARRVAGDARRAAARRQVRERRATNVEQTQPDLEAAFRELQAVLAQEVERLPEKYRTPLILCYLEGKTVAQAAQELPKA